jgi:DNA-binding response OmpR family regulator
MDHHGMRKGVSRPSHWFCSLLDTAPDVYFRYAVDPTPRLAYISPSVEALTGHTQAAFYATPDLCVSVVAGPDRRLLRRLPVARRSLVVTLHLRRNEVDIPVELRAVPVVRRRRVIAIEGVVRLAVRGESRSGQQGSVVDERSPVQQRLTALMCEVHELLHRVLPPGATRQASDRPRVLELGDLALDTDRLVVTESGQQVALTAREVQVLRYLIERPGRVVTRHHLLTDVWGYTYTGDDRTVDVHVSRLRRKLPSLRDRLLAIRNLGYRLEVDAPKRVATGS